jgi:hypothetical protein
MDGEVGSRKPTDGEAKLFQQGIKSKEVENEEKGIVHWGTIRVGD